MSTINEQSYPHGTSSLTLQALYVELLDASKNYFTHATGFFLNSGFDKNCKPIDTLSFVTARHVVTGKDFFTDNQTHSLRKNVCRFLSGVLLLCWCC